MYLFLSCRTDVHLSNLSDPRTVEISLKNPIYPSLGIYPSRTSNSHCIRCICVHLGGSLDRTEPRQTGTETPYTIPAAMLLQISGPPHKHQKAITDNIVIQIDKKQHSHPSTAIGKLIEGFLLFGMKSWEYYTTPKGEKKKTSCVRETSSFTGIDTMSYTAAVEYTGQTRYHQCYGHIKWCQ